jgi:hypothetical protein
MDKNPYLDFEYFKMRKLETEGSETKRLVQEEVG